MRPRAREKIPSFIELNIERFHKRRLENLLTLSLSKILKRKNPYLFKAKNLVTAHDLVKSLLDAHMSSQEEGIFGEFLEGLAQFVSSKTYGGKKSAAEGIDLEFEKDRTKYIVAIKSGPNWGNSQQIKRMRDNFKKAARILRTGAKAHIIAVNGCCYGRDDNPDKGDYHKLCGQRFWEFISGDKSLYMDIIEPLGHRAKARNERFLTEYAKVINRFVLDFSKTYCDPEGAILWGKLVQFNSGKLKNTHLLY